MLLPGSVEPLTAAEPGLVAQTLSRVSATARVSLNISSMGNLRSGQFPFLVEPPPSFCCLGNAEERLSSLAWISENWPIQSAGGGGVEVVVVVELDASADAEAEASCLRVIFLGRGLFLCMRDDDVLSGVTTV